jgi:hypothetical protein
MNFLKRILFFSYKTFVFSIGIIKRIFYFLSTKTHSQNEKVIEENNEKEINLSNSSNGESSNSNSLVHDLLYNLNNVGRENLPGIFNLELESLRKLLHNYTPYDRLIFKTQKFGLCPECNQPNTFEAWCKDCYSKQFKENFGYWTSGNEEIDKFIQNTQLQAVNRYEVLEWIPYDQLRNIKHFAEGENGIIYSAIWLGGNIQLWNYEIQNWHRTKSELEEYHYKDSSNPQIKNPLKDNEKYGYHVLLKSLKNPKNKNFLKEVTLYTILLILIIYYIQIINIYFNTVEISFILSI